MLEEFMGFLTYIDLKEDGTKSKFGGESMGEVEKCGETVLTGKNLNFALVQSFGSAFS